MASGTSKWSAGSSAPIQVLAHGMTGHMSYFAGRPLSSPNPDISRVLETKYGIKAELKADGTEVFKITAYRYRVMPDWQTTSLWYNVDNLPDDDPVVELDVIKDRYPQIYPFHLKWVDILERQYAREYGPRGDSDDDALSREQRTAVSYYSHHIH
ncbi:hypothetical protein PV04_06222 [Phialophora macrospora]|uniref:Uncharacterized protein n=1 Tax=Phialophora macrospora TaxID=1851006 RepID=A0A0D2CP32_9EURO|nr:hypothetical protein PV04_06222 [Phialophora macrospora]